MNIESGEIYFVREVDPHTKKFTKFVKIGLVHESEERDSLTRLKDHQTGNPRSLELPPGNYFKVPAVTAVEAMMHKFYAQLRISGEWFEFDSESHVDKAKIKAKQLGDEVASFIPVFEAAGKLANTTSNGKTLEPSTKALEIWEKLSLAQAKLNALKALDSRLEARFKEAADAGIELGDLVTKGTRREQRKFPWETLKEKHPAIYKQFHKSVSKIDGSFTPKYKAAKTLDFGEEFTRLEARLSKIISSTSDQNLVALNMPKLELVYEISLLDWEKTLLKAELMIVCGKNDVLIKVCEWKRKRVTVDKFDLQKLKKKYPEIHKEISGPVTTKASLRATKKKRT
jgi:hypothetical protein